MPYMYIYPLIYTPLPNSVWLHDTHVTALRYVRSVQLGAYVWLDGLNWIQMGSILAQVPRLSTPVGVVSFLEPIVTHF